MTDDAPRYMNRTASTQDVCETYGISKATVARWVKAGCPAAKSRGRHGNRFNLDEVRQWMDVMGRDGSGGGPPEERKPVAGGSAPNGAPPEAAAAAPSGAAPDGAVGFTPRDALVRARVRKTILDAQRAEVKLRQERAELVEAEEVERGRLARVAHARAVLLGGPASLAPDLEGRAASEIEHLLRDWVHAALTELAGDAA